MAENPEAINAALATLIEPETRGRLLARGLARGMVWRDGVVPEGAPDFAPSLTRDLLDFGYAVLALALELRDANTNRQPNTQFATSEPLRVAAEAIESAVRRGDPNNRDQGRDLVISAAAFHLAGYAARSFSLLPLPALNKNLASHERALGFLLRRDLVLLREHIIQWHANPAHTDDQITARLLDETDDFSAEDAAVLALSTQYHSGLGLADTALSSGNGDLFNQSMVMIERVASSASEIGNIPTWWVATLSRHLLRDLWHDSLFQRLPTGPAPGLPPLWTALRSDFIAQLGTRRPPHIDLWPSQIAAAERAINPDDDLVIALPTSAGKTRIAELCILRTLADQRRIIYVTPLRALSAQIERVLARTFVPLGRAVTSLYGASGATLIDAKTLVSADLVVATPEKLDFALRQDPTVLNDIGLVVFDEGHMIGLGSREIRYEVLIQRLLRRQDADQRRIVCLSAMFNPEDPYFKDFANWLRSDAPGDSVHVQWRPTRQRLATLDWSQRSKSATLYFLDGEKPYVPRFIEENDAKKPRRTPFPKNDVEFCISAANAFARDGHTVLVYSPLKSQVEPLAREFRRIRDQGYLESVKAPQPEHIAVALAIGREWLGTDHAAVRALEAGIGTHHGALPRPFLNAVEELLDERRLSVVIASPTLAQGIDLACSVLIFRSLRRYEDGEWVPISPAEFGNVIGRAGRAYVDLDGISVLPTFDAQSRAELHRIFSNLIQKSRGQRLLSGLALLISRMARLLIRKLGVPKDSLLDYVLNHRDLWNDSRLATSVQEENEDESDETYEGYAADLDVALFSLVEPLDLKTEDLAAALDSTLHSSLWQRTLVHHDQTIMAIEREILRSRAEWLWSSTSPGQRAACFNSGLGRKPGLFLHAQLDSLVDSLAEFQAAVQRADGDAAGKAAIRFADNVIKESFFTVRRLPENWQTALASWVEGIAFSEILGSKNARDAHRTQVFIQEGVVFKLVWAAEAVRVQAIASGHSRAGELGDGPALALTYGVPCIPAALLSQIGFASRLGAHWVTRELSATFTDMPGLRDWLRLNDGLLSLREFWPTEDLYLLWSQVSAPTTMDYPTPWKHARHTISVKWQASPAPADSILRVVAGHDHSATICAADLVPLGTSELPVDPHAGAIAATALPNGQVRIDYFGKG
jgi:DEAD/DEAH box helicase